MKKLKIEKIKKINEKKTCKLIKHTDSIINK